MRGLGFELAHKEPSFFETQKILFIIARFTESHHAPSVHRYLSDFVFMYA